jgi:DNA-binding response OmpR family regulator
MIEDKTIWVLEDEKDHQDIILDIFSLRYKVKAFDRLEDFMTTYNDPNVEKPDLLIADLVLHDKHFFDIFNSNNDFVLSTPFIIVSSMTDIDALRYCFEEGAIDYLIKPFKKNELLAKIEVHLRKIDIMKEQKKKESFSDNIDFDQLTVKEGKILKCLLESKDYIAHREELIRYIWGEVCVHPKTLDVHMYNLRRKIKSNGYRIKTEGDGNFKLITKEYIRVAQ